MKFSIIKSVIKNVWSNLSRTKHLLILSAVYIVTTASVKADDTEIYLANNSPFTQPNLLFVVDTSGSMDNIPGGATEKKIDQLKVALAGLLATLQNVNVGLMVFSAPTERGGGPVLYPVKDIDAGLIDINVNGGNDDGYGDMNGVTLTGNSLSMGAVGTVVALRFDEVYVPQGAAIASAYLEFTAIAGVLPTALEIRGHKHLDSPALTTIDINNITSRPGTDAVVEWNSIPTWSDGDRPVSPELNSIVKEISDQPGWCGGQAMTFIINGGGNREIKTRDASATFAPKLHITYNDTNLEPPATGCNGVHTKHTVRDELAALVSTLPASGYTPISGVFSEAASYYRGDAVTFGKLRGTSGNYDSENRTSHNDSFSGGLRYLPPGCDSSSSSDPACADEEINGNPVYISPIADICQINGIILLSDGDPNSHRSETATIIKDITGSNCSSASDGKDCSKDLAEALYTNDQSTTLNGEQIVQTHTIGFALSSSAQTFFDNLAEKGGGTAYEVTDAATLEKAFIDAANTIENSARTFASAGVSVNQANRLTHRDELYFALFNPSTVTVWPGNLKRYKLLNGAIADINNAAAIHTVGEFKGRFKESSRSFWSIEDDGDFVTKGGVANTMTTTRKVYSNVTGNPLIHADNRVISTSTTITAADLDVGAADKVDTLHWASGIDSDGNARQEVGDPLHSKPLLVTYDDGAGQSGDSLVFVGTNQGYLHAILTSTGLEQWAFIPKMLLKNLTLFKNNTPQANHVYGVDGAISLYHDDLDNDSLIDTGETAILYVGMRRGGKNYYAIDISTANTPVLKFIIEGGAGDYAELGETWSKISVGKMKIAGTDKAVLVFGGGYDTNQDTAGAHAVDSVGRTVFIADALTGSRIWTARTNSNNPDTGISAKANMSNSIPADIKAIDLTGSGLIEHIYASDTAGQVFRFDVDNLGNSGFSDLVTGGLLAKLQTGAATEENNRRFYNGPDVAAINRPGYKDFIAVSLGSGYRAHPTNNNTNDKFYVIRDTWILDHKTFPGSALDEDNLADVSTVIGDANSDGVSDALALIENPLSPKHGWFIDFKQTGEKVLAESITFNSQVIVSTYIPLIRGVSVSDICAPEGTSRAYILNIVDGTPAVDNNTDGDLEDLVSGTDDKTACGDRCFEVGRGIPPSGLVLFQPEGATICFGTQCFDDMLSFEGERLQRVKWRRRQPE